MNTEHQQFTPEQIRDGFASFYKTGAQDQVFRNRVQTAYRLLSNSARKDVLDEALRLSTKEEKAQGTPAPFVQAVAGRMSPESAIVQLSVLRAIAKAWFDAEMRFDPEKQSWDSLYNDAKMALKGQRSHRDEERKSIAQGALIAKAIQQVADKQDMAAVLDKAAELQREEEAKAARDNYVSMLRDIADRVFKAKVDDTLAFARDVIETLQTRVNLAQGLRDKAAAEAKAQPTQTIEAQPDTAQAQQDHAEAVRQAVNE